MTEELKFGPEWLRALSDGNNSASAASTKRYKLADHRYSREEMLALFNRDTKPPACVAKFQSFVIKQCQDPLTLMSLTDEEQRLMSLGVNSVGALRNTGRSVGPPSSQSIRGSGPPERGRGRGWNPNDGYQRRDMGDDMDGYGRGRGRLDGWEDNRRYERSRSSYDDHGPPAPRADFSRSTSSDNWRGKDDPRGDDEGGDWRHVPPRKDWNNRGNWRDHPRVEFDRTARLNGPISRSPFDRPNYRRSKSESFDEDQLPEWSTNDDDEEIGSFDATGQFVFLKESEENRHMIGRIKQNDADQHKSNPDITESKSLPSQHTDKSPSKQEKSPPRDTTLPIKQDSTPIVRPRSSYNGEDCMKPNVVQRKTSPISQQQKSPTHVINNQAKTLIVKSEQKNNAHSTYLNSPKNTAEHNQISDSSRLLSASEANTKLANIIASEVKIYNTDVTKNQLSQNTSHAVVLNENVTTKTPVNTQIPQTVNSMPHRDDLPVISNISQSNEEFAHAGESVEDPLKMLERNAESIVATVVNEKEDSIPNPPDQSASSEPVTWYYKDPHDVIQGPFAASDMAEWYNTGYFTLTLAVKRNCDTHFQTLGDLVMANGGRIPFLDNPSKSADPVTKSEVSGPGQAKVLQQQMLLQHQFQTQMMLMRQMQFQATMSSLQQQPDFQKLSPLQQQELLMKMMMFGAPQMDASRPPVPPNIAPTVGHNITPQAASTTVPAFQRSHSQPTTTAQSGWNPNAPPFMQGQWSQPSSVWDLEQSGKSSDGNNQEDSSRQEENLSREEDLRRKEIERLQQEEFKRLTMNRLKTVEDQGKLQLERRQEKKRQDEMQWNEDIRRQAEIRRQEEFKIQELQRQDEQRRKEEIRQEELRRREEMIRQEEQRRIEEEKRKKDEERRILEEKRRVEDMMRQKIEEERRKEEQRKLEEAMRLEEERRLEQERILEEQRRLEEQRILEEQRLIEEQKRIEEMKIQEELRKQEEIKKQEELKRQEIEIKKEEERRRAEILHFAMLQQESAQLANVQLPSATQWADWNAQLHQNRPDMPLPQIQQLEIENERQQIERSKRQAETKRQHEQQNANQHQKASKTWSDASPEKKPMSLLEIQEEQERQLLREKQLKGDKTDKDFVSIVSGPVWGNSNISAKWASEGTWGKSNSQPPPVQSAWNVSPTPAIKKNKKVDTTNFPSLNIKPSQTSSQKASVKTKSSNQDAPKPTKQQVAVQKIFQPTAPSDDFMKWCEQFLSGHATTVDIPTFVSFLQDVDSPHELNDYVRSYLGDKKFAADFARQFMEKKKQYKNKLRQQQAQGQGHSQSHSQLTEEESIWGPVSKTNNPKPTLSLTSLTSDDAQKNKGKKKKRMQKVDSSILGFTVHASQGRVNAGEIESAEL